MGSLETWGKAIVFATFLGLLLGLLYPIIAEAWRSWRAGYRLQAIRDITPLLIVLLFLIGFTLMGVGMATGR